MSGGIVWTDYMVYRLNLRGFNMDMVADILKYSPEKYVDTVTGRSVVVGRHDKMLVLIPYEYDGETITPVTIHATNRQQINARIKSGRLKSE